MTMKRFVKYWMIRLLSREFVALPMRCKLVGLWWCLSLMVLCGYADPQPQWPLLIVVANFAGSSFAVTAAFKTIK